MALSHLESFHSSELGVHLVSKSQSKAGNMPETKAQPRLNDIGSNFMYAEATKISPGLSPNEEAILVTI